MPRERKTHDKYIAEVAEINPNIEVVEEYINDGTKILHRCKICGHEWKPKPSNILQHHGCPVCAKNKSHKSNKTHDGYISELFIKNPKIEVVGTYINNSTRILHRCRECGYVWNTSPSCTLNGKGCPVCVNGRHIIGLAPEYKNSIWASKYKEMFSKYLTEEQMKTNMPKSHKKIDFVCPDCGRHKMRSPHDVVKQGFSCTCRDGISYPNKFIYGFLNQFEIEYETEKIFNWSNGKKYDVYIPLFNCIIENHGAQHYERSFEFIGGRTLEEEQENDKYKEQLAINNGIEHYIQLDCRKSTIKWIKSSIVNSDLQNLFNLDIVDWNQCGQFASSNMIKQSADFWMAKYSAEEISNELCIAVPTVYKYLRIAKECGIIDTKSR